MTVLSEGIQSLSLNPLVTALVESTRRRFLSTSSSSQTTEGESAQDSVVDPMTCDWCSTQDVECFHCRKCWSNICETCRSEGKYSDHSVLCLNPTLAQEPVDHGFPFYFTQHSASRAVKTFLSQKGLVNVNIVDPNPVTVPHFLQTVTATIVRKGADIAIRKYEVLVPPVHLRSRISREERRMWDSKEFELLGYAAQAFEIASQHMETVTAMCSTVLHGLAFPSTLTRVDLSFASVVATLMRYIGVLIQCALCPTLKRLALIANLRGCKITERLHQLYNQSSDEHHKNQLSRKLHGHLEIGATYTQHTQTKEKATSKTSVEILARADHIQATVLNLCKKLQLPDCDTTDVNGFFTSNASMPKLRAAILHLISLSRTSDKKLQEEVHEATRNIGISEETRKQILTTGNNISSAVEMLTNTLGRLSHVSFTWFTLGMVFPSFLSNTEICRFCSQWTEDLSKKLCHALPYGSGASPTNPVSQVIEQLAPQIDQLRQQQLEVARNNRLSFVSNFSFFHSQMCNVLSQLVEVFLKSHSFALVETMKCLGSFVETAACQILVAFASVVPEEFKKHFAVDLSVASSKSLLAFTKFEGDFFQWLHDHPQNNPSVRFPNVCSFLRLEKISAALISSDFSELLTIDSIVPTTGLSAAASQEEFDFDSGCESYAISVCRSLLAEDLPKLVHSSAFELEGSPRRVLIPYFEGYFSLKKGPKEQSKLYSYFVEGQTGDCIHDEVEPTKIELVEKKVFQRLSGVSLFLLLNVCAAIFASKPSAPSL